MTLRPRTTTARAVAQYTEWSRPKVAPSTLRFRSVYLSRFQAHCRTEWLHEISPAQIETFVGTEKSQATYVLRGFLKWANERFALSLFVPPTRPYRRNWDRAAEYEERSRAHAALARGVAERLTLPHQRLIFYLGFLYGWPLARIQNAAVDEVVGVSPMRADIYELVTLASRGTLSSGYFFEPWLGRSRRHASRMWGEWSGGVEMMRIIMAGNSARIAHGIRPKMRRRTAGALWQLPPFDEVSVERMPRMWGGA